MKEVAVLLNRRAGNGEHYGPSRLREAFEAHGVRVRFIPHEPNRLSEFADALARERPDALVAAGGDGTVATLARAASRHRVPLGIVPLGTFNHFARDLGLPQDPEEAVRTIAEGRLARVDLGEVNGRVFLNNSSIGLYPHLVGERERQRRSLGVGKRVAMALAILRLLFRRVPLMRVTLEAHGERLTMTTPFVFVGNNEYLTGPGALGTRDRLDDGHLALLAARCTGRLCVFRLALAALLGTLDSSPRLEKREVTALQLHAGSTPLKVGMDGEIVRIPPPLEYRIHPGALEVLTPGPHP